MKISVNLATRPFVELRPFFLRLRLLMGLLVLIAIGLAVGGHAMRVKLDRSQAQMDALRRRTIAAQQQKIRAETSMHQEPRALVLERAHFLNRLFLYKSFSWTAVMMDLETVMPVGVQVSSIEPVVRPDGDVDIRLKVTGERERAIELVRNLEHSRRFLAPRLTGESTLAKEGNGRSATAAPLNPNEPVGTEFDILARYNPLPVNESYRFTKTKGSEAAATAAAKRPAPTNSRYPRNGVVLPPAPGKGGATR